MVNGLGHLGFYLGRLLHIVINCDDDETQNDDKSDDVMMTRVMMT